MPLGRKLCACCTRSSQYSPNRQAQGEKESNFDSEILDLQVQANGDSSDPSVFACVPLPHYPPPVDTPNTWRAADLLRASAPFNETVTVLPFHALTTGLHLYHPGRVAKTHARKSNVDCSHLRYSPFLYDPVWWAIMHTISSAEGGLGRRQQPQTQVRRG